MKKHITVIQILTINIVLLFLATACGGGGGDNDGGPGGVVSDNTDSNNQADDGVTDEITGKYDLAEYIFDASLEQVGSIVSYGVRVHNQKTGNEVMAEFEKSEQWEKTDYNTVVFSVNNTGEPANTYIIHDTVIDDINHDIDNIMTSMPRFVSVGDTYVNKNYSTSLSENTNANCVVLDHLDSFDISTLTLGMADGVYQNVLHAHCVATFSGILMSDVEIFYAKGIGHVLGIDNKGIFVGGPTVIIQERSGTVYYGSGY